MKAKKIWTVKKRMEKDITKKYHSLSSVSVDKNKRNITINKVTKTKTNPPYYKQDIKKVQALRDIDGSWKFYNKKGDKLKYKDLVK